MNMNRQDSFDTRWILHPECAKLGSLCDFLKSHSGRLGGAEDWPKEQLAECGRTGVFRWFIPDELGGEGWSSVDVVKGYLQLSAACLTTTFVITQLTGACRRIVGSSNKELKAQLIPKLLTGESLATLGISHLTTSGQHKKKPALTATPTDGGFVLEGFSPWVTGGIGSDYIVIGASLDDGRELMAVVPTDLPGVECAPPADIVALASSQTGAVKFKQAFLASEFVLAGPIENVMKQGVGANTGGLQTSTLALGVGTAALDFIRGESVQRPELVGPLDQMQTECDGLREQLLSMAEGGDAGVSPGELRARLNSFVLRTTQAGLVAAKGRGFVKGHPAGRWCQEALFFLVWSCPQPVIEANLCELAGIV